MSKIVIKKRRFIVKNWLVCINQILLFLFVFNSVFIPVDTFQLKKISLILLLLLNLGAYTKIKDDISKYCVAYGLLFTIVIIFHSIITGGNIVDSVISAYMGFILLLYPISKKNNIDLFLIFRRILEIEAIFIAVSGFMHFAGIILVDSNPILMRLYNSNNAMVGAGDYLAIPICIFLKTSPLLLIMIPYYIVRKNYSFTLIFTLALIFSGTRANILISVFTVVLSLIYAKDFKYKKIFKIILIFTIGVYLFVSIDVLEVIKIMFEKKSYGDDVRLLTLISIKNLWENNPISFFLGFGMTSSFYNIAYNSYTVLVELTYWNLLRQLGLFLFVLAMYMFLKPLFSVAKNKNTRVLSFGYISYLIVAYTNPLLYSSTGFCALLIMLYLSEKSERRILS